MFTMDKFTPFAPGLCCTLRHSGRVKRSSLLVSLPLYRLFTILTPTNTCSKAVVCLVWTNLHLLPQVSVVRHSGRVKRSSLLVSLPLYRMFTILTLTNTCSKAVVCLLWTNLHLLPQYVQSLTSIAVTHQR